jgi:LCP family protein required for cell wall assembly
MSNFKTRKIPAQKKIIKTISTETSPDLPLQPDKNITVRKWIVGILIGILSLFCIGTIALRGLWSMSITSGNGGTIFTPISAIGVGSGTIEKIAGTKNILIAGIGGAGHDGSLLTDSIMLASINSDGGYVTLVSIPRDLYVAYPKGYGSAGKINALYSMGVGNKVGIKLLAEKVSQITGQGIDGYIVIDFSGFKNIVDALGGIDIDAPKDLVDREYPDNNWGYEIFTVRAGLQNFDGETALKYARSRHSTSDFDRSERQQLLLKWIKEKAFSLGFFTSPTKINEVYTAVVSHLDTSMTLGDIGDFALRLKDIKTDHINIYNLSNECVGIKCTAGAYLYTPSREYFAGASVVIPENASATKLSYYDDIRRFTGFVFRFPDIRKERAPISIISGKGKSNTAKSIITSLGKLGITFDDKKTLTESTGSIDNSHINIYWNSEAEIGTPASSPIIQALKFLEEKIPYSTVIHNEYITTDGPRIEIVVGNDIGSYFTFAKPAYYLPYLAPPVTGTGIAGTATTGSLISWEQNSRPPTKKDTKIQSPSVTAPTIPKSDVINVTPWQWEEF